MKKMILASAILLLSTIRVDAQCALDLQTSDLRSGKRYEVSWARVPGATSYVLEESSATQPLTNRLEIPQDNATTRYRREFARRSTTDVVVTYRVTAVGVNFCSASKNVTYRTDTAFRKLMTRAVIPLVGSTPGAYGSLFKTSLVLRASDSTGQRGKLVFHPSGTPATVADPSIAYNLPNSNSVMAWDDVVAAFGATGLGSIDIVPDITAAYIRVPYADVRLFNVTAQGTFGTLEAQTQPYAFTDDNPDADPSLRVTVPATELRLNIGVRTFDDSQINVTVLRDKQKIVDRFWLVTGDLLQFTTANAFVGADLLPGDEIFVRVYGSGIPIYSLTDNRTNDPALFVPPAPIQLDLSRFEIID
jgi:hypothetical protein